MFKCLTFQLKTSGAYSLEENTGSILSSFWEKNVLLELFRNLICRLSVAFKNPETTNTTFFVGTKGQNLQLSIILLLVMM
jgi:hypothetical protein